MLVCSLVPRPQGKGCHPPRRLEPGWVCSLASGLALGMAFPAHPEAPAAAAHHPVWAWVGLVPLLAVLPSASPSDSFRRGWIAGASWALVALYWVAYTQGGGLAVVGATGLLAGYLGLFVGLFALAQNLLVRRFGTRAMLAAPILWVGQEYLVSLGELGFPWLLLGHSQVAIPRLVQYASVTGTYGVSAWVVLVNVSVLTGIAPQCSARRRSGALVVLAAALIAPWWHGGHVLSSAAAADRGLRIAVVQPNIGTTEGWSADGLEQALARLAALSQQAITADSVDLLVWPESAVPCYLAQRPQCRARVQALVDSWGVPLLAGASDYDQDRGEPYNAAFLLWPGRGDMQRYAKMHLVPFGERTPFRDRVPLLGRINWAALTGDLGPAEFAAGTERTLFRLPAARFVVLICFEAVFPDLARRGVEAGADLLVNITNDSWFGASAGPYQHAQLAAMRAVENRTPMARCATTGLSLFIDAYGRVHQQLGLGAAGVRTHTLAAGSGGTAYTRYGDWLAQAALALSLALVLTAWRPWSRWKGR